MRGSRKTWISGSIAFLMALSLLEGARQVRARMLTSLRPWQLEASLESLLTGCRTGPGSWCFRAECDQLEARAEDAKRLLLETDREWWLWRDYSSSLEKMLAAGLDAHSLRIRLALRRQEQKGKVTVLLKSLQGELAAGKGRIWSRFELRSLEAERSESLARQAEYLAEGGDYESALRVLARAWIAWERFTYTTDLQFARFEDPQERRKWDRQAMDLLQWTQKSGRPAILVDKFEHLCLLLRQGKIELVYSADLGRSWYRRKVQELDASTPEGEYRVKSMKPAGKYRHALLLDYPNVADRRRFQSLKRTNQISADARIGSYIEIHGGAKGDQDWTDGCVSLHDADMRDLYRRAYPGMRVTIVGRCGLAAGAQEPRAASR